MSWHGEGESIWRIWHQQSTHQALPFVSDHRIANMSSPIMGYQGCICEHGFVEAEERSLCFTNREESSGLGTCSETQVDQAARSSPRESAREFSLSIESHTFPPPPPPQSYFGLRSLRPARRGPKVALKTSHDISESHGLRFPL